MYNRRTSIDDDIEFSDSESESNSSSEASSSSSENSDYDEDTFQRYHQLQVAGRASIAGGRPSISGAPPRRNSVLQQFSNSNTNPSSTGPGSSTLGAGLNAGHNLSRRASFNVNMSMIPLALRKLSSKNGDTPLDQEEIQTPINNRETPTLTTPTLSTNPFAPESNSTSKLTSAQAPRKSISGQGHRMSVSTGNCHHSTQTTNLNWCS